MAERTRMKTSWLSIRKSNLTLGLLKDKNRLASCDVTKESVNVEVCSLESFSVEPLIKPLEEEGHLSSRKLGCMTCKNYLV